MFALLTVYLHFYSSSGTDFFSLSIFFSPWIAFLHKIFIVKNTNYVLGCLWNMWIDVIQMIKQWVSHYWGGFVCLCIISVVVCVCLSAYLSACLSTVTVSVCLSVGGSVYIYLCLNVRLSVYKAVLSYDTFTRQRCEMTKNAVVVDVTL